MTRANPKKGGLTPIDIIFSIVVGLGAILLISVFASEADASNNNPRKGEVKITSSIYKLCDGRNLIYTFYGNGIAVSPNDRQCK